MVRRSVGLCATVLLVGAFMLAPSDAFAAATRAPCLRCEPGGVFLRVTTPPILKATGAIVGTNWSGYVAATNVNSPATESVSAVTGTWVVPRVSVTASDAYSSDWVGIDGWTSPTVEQVGTEGDSLGGVATYSAWWEMYPAYPVYITSMTISPGDTMTGSVVWISGDTFQMSLTDVTTGVSFSAAETLGQTADRVSAEWIHEAPSWSLGVLPLAATSPATFTACQTTINGVQGPIGSPLWQNSSMDLVQASDFSVLLAEPTALASGGANMIVNKPKPFTSTLTIGSSPGSVRLPTSFLLSGVLTPGDPDPSDLIVVQVTKPGSARWSYSSARLVYAQNANTGGGLWSYRYAPTLRGTYKFKASFAGEDGQTPATSRVISVVVR